jgi:imidazolonepropionase-like amidohydrolase
MHLVNRTVPDVPRAFLARVAVAVAASSCLIPPAEVRAQDLTIINARIIDGTGQVIERGSIVITAGRITSVTAHDASAGTAANEPGSGTADIDANGMTVMPGLIDTHRHDLLGDLGAMPSFRNDTDVAAAIDSITPGRLHSLLEQGFTTVMMPGTYLSPSQRVRRLLKDGTIGGPRLLFSGPGFTAPGDFPATGMVCQGNGYCAEQVAFQVTDAARARSYVRSLAEAGVDAIKLFVDDAGADLDDDVFAAVVGEAASLGLATMLHAHRVADMLDGVRLGVDRLVHTPGDAPIAAGDGARILRERGVAIATTVSLSSPQFAQAAGFEYSGATRHRQVLENIRHLVDEGVVVAFGTDSPDFITAQVELEQLGTVLTPAEIIAAMTRDAATFLNLDDEIGTLETGKRADIVIVDGDPLTDIMDLAQIAVVVRDGQITVDRRQRAPQLD